MRFTYIDSEGRHVEVDSIEELGAQIQLGVLTASMQLYDPAEDRWGPAGEHAVFAALSNPERPTESVSLDDVARPSPLSTPGPADGPALGVDSELLPSDSAAPPKEWTDAIKNEFLGAVPGQANDEDQPTDAAFSDGPAKPGPMAGFPDFGAPLPASPSIDESVGPTDPSGGSTGSDGPAAGFSDGPAGLPDGSTGLSDTSAGPSDTSAGPSDTSAGPSDGPAGLSDGPAGLQDSAAGIGGLTFDPVSPDPQDLPSGPSGMDRVDGASTVFEGFDNPGGNLSGPVDGDGMKFETFMPKPSGGTEDGPVTDLDETPETEAAVEDEEDFFLIQDLNIDGSDEGAPATKKSRRSRKPSRFHIGAVAAIGLLVMAGALALPQLRDGVAESEAATNDSSVKDGWTAPVENLPTYLRTEGVYLARQAQQDVMAGLDSIRRTLGLESAPPTDWMEGVYFAHGSRYPGVQGYWERYRSYLGYAERASEQLFASSLEARVAASAIREEEQSVVIDAMVGQFAQAQPQRAAVFDGLTALSNAALELHDFLVLKEDDIEYAPFTSSGVSKDPILEAVPANDRVKRELWDRLEQVTGGLEDLGALDRVTTARLHSLLVEGLERASTF